ncbi:hypothetical protein RFI_37982, partial [Reticulomyxa filosa]
DEVNTSPDIGWFKELICDRRLDGVKIRDQVKIIAACNPYRQRKIQNTDNINDPLNKWVYRVFPLCETMKEYVWFFGQLSALDEKQYIRAMIKQLKEKFDKKSNVFKEIENSELKITKSIVKSQQFLRKHLANESIVSLRDVSRCLKFFHWLMQQPQAQELSSWTNRALNIALGLCYYFRLKQSGRTEYDKIISKRNTPQFSKLLNDEIDKLSKSFEIKPQSGIFLHHILQENLFVLFFCIVTATPIILVGKPGTSKTLSLQIILDALSYRDIENFRKMLKKNGFNFNVKSLRCISFQGTRDCKPSAVKEAWDQTERYAKYKETTTLLVFDEIGLAEQSPHNPLKILHQLLENPNIPFVGISNWNLDAAKMNRMVIHFIPPMKDDDLIRTAGFIVSQSNGIFSDRDIEKITTVYKEVTRCQTDAFRPNGNRQFFGTRDFYALVKHQATLSKLTQKRSFQGYLRNFGGLDQSKSKDKLCQILSETFCLTKKEVLEQFQTLPPVMCVQKNLTEKKCTQSPDDLTVTRHCMVISENHYSWQLLLEYNILNYNHMFFFGSSFVYDTYSNITNYNQLNKIIECMHTGKTVILSNLNSIHESLYDMLNQRYQQKPSGTDSTLFILFYINLCKQT